MKPLTFALLSMLAACAPRNFGHVEPEVIAFADQVDAARGLELALDADGRIVAIAGAIHAGSLPGLARDVALALAPDAVVDGGSRIVERDGGERETWEVDLRRAGKAMHVRVRFDEEGAPHIVQTRRIAENAEVPVAVQERAAREFGAGTIDAIEVVEADSTVVFHVTKTIDSATVRMAMGRDGTITEVLRVVRCRIGTSD